MSKLAKIRNLIPRLSKNETPEKDRIPIKEKIPFSLGIWVQQTGANGVQTWALSIGPIVFMMNPVRHHAHLGRFA